MAEKRARFAFVDSVRGVAMLMMFVYHFAWDLSFFGFTGGSFFGDPFWPAFARVIVTIFLFVSGFAFALAERRGTTAGARIRRLALVGASAGLITLATYLLYPRSFVFFGILHYIFVASLLLLLLRSLPSIMLALIGLAAIAAPYLFAPAVFADFWLLWAGLSPDPVISVDYVPILPWLAVSLFGLIAGRWAVGAEHLPGLFGWRPGGVAGKTVRLLGRYSLPVYLIHQPILFGGLWLYVVATA